MAKEQLTWTNITISENAPEAVKQALVDLEAAREMEQAAKDTLAQYVATKVPVPAGHTVKIGTGFGKLSYAVAKGAARKAVTL